MKRILYVILGMLLMLLCILLLRILDPAGEKPNRLNVSNTVIQVPAGYTFVDASQWGGYVSSTTYYCENNTTHEIFECTDNKIGDKILIPEGYEFVGVSAWGLYVESRTYYCRSKETQQVFKCTS